MRRFGVIAAALAGLAIWPAGASGVIIVGSDLSDPPITIDQTCQPAGAPCTYLQFFLNKGNPYPVKSPATGTVTAFKIRSGSRDTVTFRLGRYGRTNKSARGVGTGPTVTLPGPGTHTFPAKVAIKHGTYIGIDTSKTTAFENLPCTGLGLTYFFNPLLGKPFQDIDANSICELMVQAVIVPSSVISLDPKVLNVRGKKATLRLKVPGPGELTLSGKGVRKQSASGAVAAKRVSRAGTTRLTIRPKGSALGTLERTGGVKLKVQITFAPTGGAPATQSFKLKLRKRAG